MVRKPNGEYSVSPAAMGMDVAALRRARLPRSSYQGIGSSSQKMSRGSKRRAARLAVAKSHPPLASSMRATPVPTVSRMSRTRSASSSGGRPATFTFSVRYPLSMYMAASRTRSSGRSPSR
jgi:hypothetical protein